MRTLSAPEILRVWELGQNRPSWHRALLLLAPCFPESRPSELGSLTLARRNALLLELRALIVGPEMHCLVLCPECGAPLEFSATVSELLDAEDGQRHDQRHAQGHEPNIGAALQNVFTLPIENRTISCRLPDTNDLAAAGKHLDMSGAYATLLQRSTFAEGGERLSPAVQKEAEQAIERTAPLTDIRIPLRCASGEHIWAASLDIASFLWTEVDRIATRLLDEVQALARAYGWQESEILAMSEGRRRFYLEAIHA